MEIYFILSILVTGGCGYIGSHVVKQLSEAGQDVIVLDNLSTGSCDSLLHQEKLIQADLSDYEAIVQVFAQNKISSVLHFAASTDVSESVKDPIKYYSNNTVNTLNLLNACLEFRIQNFIFSSTAAVYGPQKNGIAFEDSLTSPINPYGWSKLFCERIIEDCAKNTELNYVILRYFNVAGAEPEGRIGQKNKNSTQLIKVCCEAALGKRKALEIFGTDYETPDGTGIRDYIHVEDLASAHLAALEFLQNKKQSEIFNVGYSYGYSVKEVIQTVKKQSGSDFMVLEKERRPGDLAMMIANCEKIQTKFNWKPKFNQLETIVQHSLNWEASFQ